MRIIRVFRLLLACFCCCCQSLAAPPRPRPFESPSSPPLKSLPQRILPPPPSSRLVQLSLNNVSPTPTHADELRDAVRLDGPLKEFIALSPPPPLATSPINRIIDLTALLYIPRKHRIVRLVTGLEQLPLAILSSHVFTKLDLVAAARLRSTCQTFALACRIPFNKFNSVSSFLKILIAYSQQQQNYQYDGNHVHIVIDFIPPSIFSYFHSIILQPPFNQLSVNEHYLLIYLLMLNDSWSSELADAIGEQIDLFDEASRYNPAETWEVKKEYQTSLFVTAIKLHNLAVVKFLVEDEFIFPGKEALACALIVGDWGIIKYLLPLMNAIEFVNEEERSSFYSDLVLFAAVSRDWDLIRHMIELYHQAKDIQVPQGWFDHLKEELQSYSSTTSPLANSIYLLQHHVHDPNTKPSEDFIKIAVAIDAHELVMIEIHTMVAHFRQHHLLQQPHSNSQTSINARNIIIHAAKTGSLDLLNEMAHHFIHNGVLATIDLKTVVMTAVSHGNLHIANIYLPYLHNIGLLKGNTSVELLEASLWSHNNKTILWAFHRMEECRLLSPELVNSMIRHHVGYNMLRYMLDWCGGAIVVGKDKGGVLLSPDALKVAVLFGGGEGLSSQ